MQIETEATTKELCMTLGITRSQLLLYIHPRKQRHQVGHPRTSYRTSYRSTTPKRPARRAPALSTIVHHIEKSNKESLGSKHPWRRNTAALFARRRLMRIRVRGPFRQAVIHKTLRQGCALGFRSVSAAQLLTATCGCSLDGR